MMIFLIFVLFFKNLYVFSQDLYYCSETSANSPITINSGQWIKYETKNYPKTLAHDGNSGFICNQTFLNSGVQNLWITLVNAKMDKMVIFDDRSSTHKWTNINLNKKLQSTAIVGNAAIQVDTTVITPSSKWNAFQAIVAYLADTNDCPLNGLNYNFQDINTFVPLTSQSSNPSNENNKVLNSINCQWTVTIPDDFKLKVVLRYSQIYVGETFNIIVDGAKENLAFNISSPRKFSFEGTRFTFHYQRVRRISSPYGFFAVVSIVPLNPNLMNTSTPKYDPINGYQNNQVFKTDVQIPSNNTNLKISVSNLDLEAGCDDFTVNANGTTSVLTEYSIVRLDSRTPIASLTWSSDGNNQQAGFNYETSVIDCSAPAEVNYVLPCSGQVFNGGFPNGYCMGQQQKLQFTIDNNCSVYNFDIIIVNQLIPGDQIQVFSGEEMVLLLTGSENVAIFTTMLSSSGLKPLLVNFQSFVLPNILAITKQDGSWNISVAAKSSYAPIQKVLQTNSSTFEFELSNLRELQKLEVQSPKLIDFFIVGKYFGNLSNYNLYEGKNATFISNLSSNDTFQRLSPNYPGFYRSSSGILTVQKTLTDNSLFDVILIFRISDNYIPCNVTTIGNSGFNAKFVSNAPPFFQPADTYSNVIATATTQACTFNIVTYQNKAQIQFSSLNTSAPANTPIILYSGDGENMLAPQYTNWSQANVAAYQSNFTIPAKILTFSISQGTELSFLYRNGRPYDNYQTTKFSYINQILLFASPNFGNDFHKDSSTYYQNVTIPISQALAEFEIIVKYKNLANNGQFYILNGNSCNNLSNVNLDDAGKFSIISNNFQIVFQSTNGNYLIQCNLKNWRANPNFSTTTQKHSFSPNVIFSIINLMFMTIFLLI